MLPTSKQAEYGDEAAFTQQLQGYGVTKYSIDSGQQQGEGSQRGEPRCAGQGAYHGLEFLLLVMPSRGTAGEDL